MKYLTSKLPLAQTPQKLKKKKMMNQKTNKKKKIIVRIRMILKTVMIPTVITAQTLKKFKKKSKKPK